MRLFRSLGTFAWAEAERRHGAASPSGVWGEAARLASQGEQKKSELTAISRPEPVCVVWSWHPPLLRNATLCAPRFASVKSLRTTWTVCLPNSPELKSTERKPGRTFRPSCSSSAQFELRLFSSSSNLTDVTGCVLPNPEVCVSGNGAQQPPGGQTAGAATPAVRCAQETAQVSKNGVGGPSGAVKWDPESSQQNGKLYKAS